MDYKIRKINEHEYSSLPLLFLFTRSTGILEWGPL